MQEPQEGRRRLRETPRPPAVKTPKGVLGASGSPTARSESQGRRSREDRIRRRKRSIPGGETKLKGGTGGSGASVPARQRTSAETEARKASEEPREGSRRRRSSQRQAGRPDREVGGHTAEGESFEEFNPRSAAGLKHGGSGFGRKKAPRGSQTLKTQRNPGEASPGEVASRYRKCCREQNPGEARVATAAPQLRAGQTPKRSRRSERCTAIIKTNVVTAGA